MADIAIFRINYKSDFILTLNSDAGWMTPFCIKFWTGAPSQAYYAGYDGTNYTHCAPVEGEPTKLAVQFDDHHLPIGDLKFQIGYHFTVADFPTSVEDEVINQASVIIEVDDAPAQVMLDINGETAPEIQFSLPAYANEAQRIANEQQRIAAETQRIANEETRIQHEESRIAAEQTRQQNEQQRINQEQARVNEYARLKADAVAATGAANDAAALANQKAQLAADKAALAQAAADLANAKAQLATDKAALAASAAQLANDKAALANQKAEYAQTQGDYAKDQGDYAKAQGTIAEEDHSRAEADHGIAVDDHTQAGNDHTRAESDHGIAVDDHTQAGNDHTRAESDHGIAVDDHTQAGNDHTRAESDHGIAADDHTQAGNDHTRAESDHTRAESDHAAVEVYVDSIGVFDLSKHNAVGGVLATYANLNAALTALNALDSQYKYGGMSFKFVQSSDNKYVQFRYMLEYANTTAGNAAFANVANWQGVDEEPTAGSDNLVKSGGVNLLIGQGEKTLDSSILTKPGYINSDGEIVVPSPTTTYHYAQIGIVSGEVIKVYAMSDAASILNFAVYNKNDELVHSYNNTLFQLNTYTATENDAYIRVGVSETREPYFYCKLSSYGITKDIENIKDSISSISTEIDYLEKEVFDYITFNQTSVVTNVTNGRVYKNNSVGSAPTIADYSGMKGVLLDIKKGESLVIEGKAGNLYRLWAKVNNGIVVECAPYNSAEQVVTLSCDGTYDQVCLNFVVTPSSVHYALYRKESLGVYLSNELNNKISGWLNGKTVILCGDSQVDTADNFNNIISESLNVNAINCGFSGCRMSTYTGGVQANNCFSMVAVADALATQDFTYMESGLTTYPSYATHVNNLKGLQLGDGDNHIITIAYGGNDFKDGASIGDATESATHQTLIGAMTYVIQTLLTAFPKLMIVFVGLPYRVYEYSGTTITVDSDDYTKIIDGNTYHRVDYSDAIGRCAANNHLKFFDMYRRCCRTKYNAFAIGSDGTHPTSTYGKQLTAKLYCEMLTSF